MTTQTTTAVIGNQTMSKIFTVTATDGQWENVLVDSISSQPLGILMPNAVINTVQANYAAGCGAWRIINSQSLRVAAQGLMTKTGYNEFSSQKIPSIRVNPNDIIQTYSMVVNSTAGDTNVLAFVKTSKGEMLYKTTTAADSTPTAMTTAVNGLSLGSDAFGATLTNLDIQCEDGAQLVSAEIIDNAGGTVWTGYGAFRGSTGGSNSQQYNGKFTNLSIPIKRGYALKVSTVTG